MWRPGELRFLIGVKYPVGRDRQKTWPQQRRGVRQIRDLNQATPSFRHASGDTFLSCLSPAIKRYKPRERRLRGCSSCAPPSAPPAGRANKRSTRRPRPCSRWFTSPDLKDAKAMLDVFDARRLSFWPQNLVRNGGPELAQKRPVSRA